MTPLLPLLNRLPISLTTRPNTITNFNPTTNLVLNQPTVLTAPMAMLSVLLLVTGT